MDFADGGDLYTSIAQQKKLNQYFLYTILVYI